MELSAVKSGIGETVLGYGTEYTFTECILYRDPGTGKLKYSCTLLDKNGNSTIRVPLEKVELKGVDKNGSSSGADNKQQERY